MAISSQSFERRGHASKGPLGLVVAVGLTVGLVGEARAGQRVPADQRPATWDMSLDELRAIGLGQSRGDPVPVPAEYPRLNTGPRPVEGGVPPVPWIIFVNFDGEVLSSGMDSAQDNVTQVPGMGGEFAPYGEGDKREAVMQAVRADWAAYNFEVVDQRPAEGEYVMNMTGPTNPFGGGVLGIAPVDCLNQETHSNITFAFHSADDQFSAPITATTIGQEVAHSFGLEHVDEPNDIMNPYNAGGDPTFIDECIAVVGGAACPDQHLVHCNNGVSLEQNAHQELLMMFGPAFVDTEAPTVAILSPFDGMNFLVVPAVVSVSATVSDNAGVASVTLRNNGAVVATLTEPPWSWTVDGLGEGTYSFEVSALDAAGNEGVAVPVTVTVSEDLPGGTGEDSDGEEETEGSSQDDDAGDKGCGCRSSGPGWPPGAALLMLGLLGLRRRRN